MPPNKSNILPFPIERIEPEARIKLLLVMFESIARSAIDTDIEPEKYVDTAEKSVECFEVISSAIKHGVLKEFDDLLNVNGYTFRLCCPASPIDETLS